MSCKKFNAKYEICSAVFVKIYREIFIVIFGAVTLFSAISMAYYVYERIL